MYFHIFGRVEFDLHSTAFRRGYQAYWEIINKTLFIKEIKSVNKTILDVFGQLEPVEAYWFTGDLYLMVEDTNSHQLEYLKKIKIKVDKGVVVII
ncbi:MAG: hypothetical protein IPM82_03265 [Saprospiraceae bacterium]|nr:hypothetical protein [Saprospiraceae bacterium]